MDKIKKLMIEAEKAKDKAYAVYSNFPVGAVALMASGQVYHGCNIENSSFSLTCCAERIAIFNALANGERQFVAFAVIANTKEPISPCGACRQVMSEFFEETMPIYLFSQKRDVKETTIQQLLPYTFQFK